MVTTTCGTCGGGGAIFRPERTVSRNIERRCWDGPEGAWKTYDETVVQRLGGLDACPECAERAEAAFRSGRRDDGERTAQLLLFPTGDEVAA
jgi:hypothetical protein